MPSSCPIDSRALEGVLAPLEHARGLPREAYVDEAVFEFELEHLFRRHWQCIARESELRLPGDFIVARVADESVLAVRGADLKLRAFYNVCRHRGLELVSEERGRRQGFTCPYHGWTYELSGALTDAPHMPGTFSASCRGLREVQVDVLHGFVFVCLDTNAAELAMSLAGAPEWLHGPELQSLRLGRAVSYEVAANWKICVENFQESHHFERVHPGLQRQTPSAGASSWQGSGGWLGGLMQLAPHASTVAAEPCTGGAAAQRTPQRPWIVPPENRRRVADALAFPALLTSLQPDYLLTYRLQPLGAGCTAVVAATYFHSAAFAPEPSARDVYAFWDQVNAEDRAICERQQRGLQSRSYEPACYSLVEDGVHAFDQMVVRSYLQT